MIPNNQLEEWQKGYSTLKQENAALRVEIVKQCRLNGMGAERELKLITQNKDLKAALNIMQKDLNYIVNDMRSWGVEDCRSWEARAVEALSSPEVKRALEHLK